MQAVWDVQGLGTEEALEEAAQGFDAAPPLSQFEELTFLSPKLTLSLSLSPRREPNGTGELDDLYGRYHRAILLALAGSHDLRPQT